MRVRVINRRNNAYWYKIGEEYNVNRVGASIGPITSFQVIDGPQNGRFISGEDCEVIEDEVTKDKAFKYDFVNPSHYKKFEKETYQMMIDVWGEEAYIKHCEMCAFKYKLRAGEKPDQPVERDLEKANWYLEMANKLRNKE